jgi:L-arabinose isomerase
MWSTYVDPYQFFASIGPELRFLSVLSLCNEIDAVPAAEAAAVCRTLSERYPVLPDVDPVFFEASIRASLGLDRLARKTGVQTLVLNDVDPVLFENVGLRPGFLPLPGREDLTVVPEGDVGGGLAVTILRLLSGRPVQFIEPFYIDLAADCFVGGHAGPNDYTDPASHVTIARDIRFAKTAYKYAGAPFAWFTIPAGRKTLLHLSESKGRFKMVCTEVDALETEPFITSYSHGRFRPVRGTVTDLFARLAEIGVNQHYAVAPGDFLPRLKILAGLLDIDLTII